MGNKNDEFVGVEKLHAAVITKDDATEYTAEAPEYLAPVAEITGAPTVENKTTYYDNKAFNNYVSEGETVLSIVVSGLSAEQMAKYLGKKYDATTGRVFDNGEPAPPDVALSFRYNKGSDGYRYYQYLKGTFSGGSEDAKSKEGSVDVKTYTLTFTAINTVHEFTVGAETMSLKRIFADTTDTNFDATGWFDAVQQPAAA